MQGTIGLNNKFICANRGGAPFLEVIRPSLETGACPNGTQACSDQTSLDNTVCYANTTNCPITDLKFSDSAFVANYTTIQVDDKRWVAFSKN